MTRDEGLNICIEALSAHEDGSEDYFMLRDSLKRALNEDVPVFDFELFQAGLMDVPEGMTNGDVIKMMFPNAKVDVGQYAVRVEFDSYETNSFYVEWWNAPYKREVRE